MKQQGEEQSEKRREDKTREEKKKEDQIRERVRRRKMQVREKVEKWRGTVFVMFCGSGGSTSRLAKAAGAEPSREMRDQKVHIWKLARSTFGNKHGQNTSALDHF